MFIVLLSKLTGNVDGALSESQAWCFPRAKLHWLPLLPCEDADAGTWHLLMWQTLIGGRIDRWASFRGMNGV